MSSEKQDQNARALVGKRARDVQQAGASDLAVHTTDTRGTWTVCVGLGVNSCFLWEDQVE